MQTPEPLLILDAELALELKAFYLSRFRDATQPDKVRFAAAARLTPWPAR